METIEQICLYCWRGTVVNGTCTECHRKASLQRREAGLPPFFNLHNRYLIGEILGNGGFGITYSAFDNYEKRVVAIKELYPKDDVSRDSSSMRVIVNPGQEQLMSKLTESFLDEATLLQSVGKNPCLTEVYDIFTENNTCYYVMEYLEGSTLQSHLEKHGPMTWEELSPLLRQMLLSLYSLHKINLIHRDLSPDNLFLTNSGKLYLIDFGSVRTYSGANSFTVFVKSQFSPWEQYQFHGKQGPWTDIYALSVCTYYMLSGHLPQIATNRLEKDETPPIKTYCPALPDNIAAAIDKGMSVMAENRFQSIPELMSAMFPSQSPPPKYRQPVVSATREVVCRAGTYVGMRIKLQTGCCVSFGRNPDNDVCYPDDTSGVSRRQCMLFLHENGALYVKDLKSSYGTIVDGRRLESGWSPISVGSVIAFGNECFIVEQ